MSPETEAGLILLAGATFPFWAWGLWVLIVIGCVLVKEKLLR